MHLDSTDYTAWADQNLSSKYRPLWKRLLAWLDAGGDDGHFLFDYKLWKQTAPRESTCNMVCCIGGWLAAHVMKERKGADVTFELYEVAHELGLQAHKAHELFLGMYGEREKVTPPVAATCVRHFLATGEVDWNRAIGSV